MENRARKVFSAVALILMLPILRFSRNYLTLTALFCDAPVT
jgi:hypothetical protein